jgi:hypothetical protein
VPSNRTDLKAVRNLVSEAKTILDTTTLPEGRSQRAQELLGAAIELMDLLLAVKPAAVMGAKGGRSTAKKMVEKDPDYYKRIAAMRKTKAGGRPRKEVL